MTLQPSAPGVVFANEPGFAATQYDSTPFVDGRAVGKVDDATLRAFCAKIGIEDAHRLGRPALLERYAARIDQIARAGAADAIAKYFKENR
jgi:hypothetical protein